MATSSTLQGRQIALRAFTAEHLTPAYLGWLQDAETLRFSNQRFRTHTRESCAAYLASFAGGANRFYAIHRRQDDRFIGTMTAYFAPPHGTADLGILIGDRTCWGQGHGLDAWQTLMNHLFDHEKLRKITAGTLRGNVGMVRIFERAGMRLEGVRAAQELVDGAPMDALLYARFRT
ncbi:MAG: GNAT family N-acetyltransferase [Verrucomicrobia bacterium]|nr:GNAT family N-acetyltransferase [Verrucomicrobiota bacterium]